jgi:hypothetical protein
MKADYQSLFLLLPMDEATDAVNSTVSQCDTLTAIGATGGKTTSSG